MTTPWRCYCGSRIVLDGATLRCPSTCGSASVFVGPLAPYLALLMWSPS